MEDHGDDVHGDAETGTRRILRLEKAVNELQMSEQIYTRSCLFFRLVQLEHCRGRFADDWWIEWWVHDQLSWLKSGEAGVSWHQKGTGVIPANDGFAVARLRDKPVI